jgi:hypothetical protein
VQLSNGSIQHELAVSCKGRFAGRCATQLQEFLLYKDESAPTGAWAARSGELQLACHWIFTASCRLRLRLREQSHIVSASTLADQDPDPDPDSAMAAMHL